MFSDFFRFELRFWLRGMMVYVFLVVIALLFFAATSSDNVQVGGTLENTFRNSPHNIQAFYSSVAILTCLMITAFVNGAASRDFAYHTDQLIFTKPLHKLSYLQGRFWGATLVAVIPMLGVSLGVIVAGWMPWIEDQQWGPISWKAHFWSIVNFAIPNTIIVASIIFAIAVWTRSTIASFIGALLLIVGYIVAQNLASNLDNETLAVMLDPFGVRAFALDTKYWTVAEKNTECLTLTGRMLINRLLWLAISMLILAAACWRFSFRQRSTKSRRPDAEQLLAPTVHATLPNVTFHQGATAAWSQFASQLRLDFLGILESPVFIVIMLAGFLNTLASLIMRSDEGFGIASLPVTYSIIDIIRGALYVFLLVVITFYAGVLVWKEREAKLDEVYDALPHPTWVTFAAKIVALTLVVMLVLFVSMLAGIAVQAGSGYTRFQVSLYLKELFVLDLAELFCLIVLAMVAHVFSPNKYFGYFLFIILVIANAFGWRMMNIETRMVRYGGLPGYTYSDLYRYAPFIPSLVWFGIYWLLFSLMVCIVAVLFWQRGCETSLRARGMKALGRWVGPLRWASVALLLTWTVTGMWVYYNTQVKNRFRTTEQQTVLQADYEKQLKSHADWPQPRVTDVKYTIDIYPDRRALRLHGEQTIANKTDQPLEKMSLITADDYTTDIEIENATLDSEVKEFNYRVYKFEQPLEPGETRHMSYTVTYESQGFENSVSNTSVVQNGTFFNNTICPQIGYQTGFELTNKRRRQKHGLGEPTPMPPLDPEDLAARMNTYISNSSDWVNVETVISTSLDQRAIAPGSLINTWEQDGRRYFHYRVDHPSLNFYSFISARYAVQTRQWKGVDIEVYYHPEHAWNVDNMLRSIRKSLEYYTENFGPYRHKQARIIEFPRVASFAQAFPGTMPYSEGIGFIADIKKEDDIDMVFYVVAHEMAHQWWAHQVIGANMQGATLLSETLAQYSALMVMEKEFGRDMMRKFLSYEMDQYLRSRGRELLAEQPLVKVESGQAYVHYRKGSVVMYYLKEMIGEDRVNAALRDLVERFGYAPPPYPTSTDLITALDKQTPADLKYLLQDLFQDITLFANRAVDATYTERTDGRYDVEVTLECQKFKAGTNGAEESVPVDDWIEIGAFAEPEKGSRYGKTLYRERVRITKSEATFTFAVDEPPALVGVDPFSLLIDRIPDDNMKKPKAAG